MAVKGRGYVKGSRTIVSHVAPFYNAQQRGINANGKARGFNSWLKPWHKI